MAQSIVDYLGGRNAPLDTRVRGTLHHPFEFDTMQSPAGRLLLESQVSWKTNHHSRLRNNSRGATHGRRGGAARRGHSSAAEQNRKSRCGEGCLDWLVLGVRKAAPITVPLVAGATRFPTPWQGFPAFHAPKHHNAQAPIHLLAPRIATENRHLRSSFSAEPSAPLVLLGLLSGSRARRDMLRCTWMRLGKTGDVHTLPGLRVKFVVGRGAAAVETSADVLQVDVVEGERMRAAGESKTKTVRGVKTGTVTTYWKLVAFLRYAALQPEPFIARGDDDVFISPQMLLAHASALLRLPGRYVYAGVFEWYSWRTRTLHSTGFGLSAGGARAIAGKTWRNCTEARLAPGHADWTEPNGGDGGDGTPAVAVDDLCVGPLAFAKGPLLLISGDAVRWLVDSAVFRRDVATARAMSDGKAAAYAGPGSGRIDDDVQLAYWMSQLPGLQIVSFRRYLAWHDRFKFGVTKEISRLLLAHKVPWHFYQNLCNHTQSLWNHAKHVVMKVACEGPPCERCAHVEDQQACIVDVELDNANVPQPPASCWPKCAFTRGVEPHLPDHCWHKAA